MQCIEWSVRRECDRWSVISECNQCGVMWRTLRGIDVSGPRNMEIVRVGAVRCGAGVRDGIAAGTTSSVWSGKVRGGRAHIGV